MEIKAAVCRATHVPVGIESIDIDRPLGREVLVRTVATGVCHSDLHVVDGDGRFALDRGIVLGHEGAGIVEAVGDQVTGIPATTWSRASPASKLRAVPAGTPTSASGGRARRPPRLSAGGRGSRRSRASVAMPSGCCSTLGGEDRR
jgi:hypothetical protein